MQWALWLLAPLVAVIGAVAFHYLVDWPSQGWIKARLADAGLKTRVANLFPHPDPAFDPFTLHTERQPRVREILLHVGPMPGAFRGQRVWEGPAGLAWG
jgi:hypothetical protein